MLRSAVPPNLLLKNSHLQGSDKPVRCNGRNPSRLLASAFSSQLRSVLRAVSCAGFPLSPAHWNRISAVLFSINALSVLLSRLSAAKVMFRTLSPQRPSVNVKIHKITYFHGENFWWVRVFTGIFSRGESGKRRIAEKFASQVGIDFFPPEWYHKVKDPGTLSGRGAGPGSGRR